MSKGAWDKGSGGEGWGKGSEGWGATAGASGGPSPTEMENLRKMLKEYDQKTSGPPQWGGWKPVNELGV